MAVVRASHSQPSHHGLKPMQVIIRHTSSSGRSAKREKHLLHITSSKTRREIFFRRRSGWIIHVRLYHATNLRSALNAHEYSMLGIAHAILLCLVASSYALSNGGAEKSSDSTTENKSSSKPRLRQSAMLSSYDASFASEGHYSTVTENLMLNTLLCKDRGCSDECQTYLTPVNTCFNGLSLFPDDPSWSEYDIFDTYTRSERRGDSEHGTDDGVGLMSWETISRRGEELKDAAPKGAENFDDASSFKRTFFRSKDSSCHDPTDEFDALPLNECIGPFGDPRPWGRFEIATRK